MSKPEIILHHYQGSPYAEKVVAALRIKGLPWCSVATSPMLPRLLLEPLTNGYRRIPVMQIGNQIFCDTALILKELEKRYPSNDGGAAEGGSQAQASVAGVSDMIATFVDKQLFANVRDQMPWGASPEEQKANPLAAVFGSAAFLADRSQLSGGSKPINTEAIRRAQPLLVDQLVSNLDTLESALQGPQEKFHRQGAQGQGAGEGGWILNTLTPSMADCSVYGKVWWLMTTKRAPEFVTPSAFPCLFAWWGQMNAYMKKHRHPTQDRVKITGEDALQVARDAQKGGSVSTGVEGVHEAERRKVGELVTVSPNDYGKVPVKGRIVAITKERVCIRPEHGPSQQEHVERIEVLMHFPRNGYMIIPVGNVKAVL
ncbi:MAG: hypothetical protein J3R72DRAFT_458035 [Linnemannia gamsii]|nr:MAG: hypothetical protein J3R72DRAFT_458035 [Linnemannia gamsii]